MPIPVIVKAVSIAKDYPVKVPVVPRAVVTFDVKVQNVASITAENTDKLIQSLMDVVILIQRNPAYGRH